MFRVALKMLIGDRAKYVGIIMGLTFASLLITQQAAIFTGIMSRTYGLITDLSAPDIWVMDERVQYIDDNKPLQDTALYRVRGVEGVAWAMPFYKGSLRVRLHTGTFQSCNVFGLDDTTLIGGPPRMIKGKLSDLRRADAVIVDAVGAKGKLAKPPLTPGGPKIPLDVGDALEINDHRAVVVGICEITRTFGSQPVIYTTYSRATTFAPAERKLLSFILVKAKPGQDIPQLCARIQRQTGLIAHPRDDFMWLTMMYFLKNTGVPVNFGTSVLLGFVVGTAIAGQTFFNFTVDNLRYFGTLKAMGASNGLLMKMIVLQALLVGAIGYGLGVGAAALFGTLSSKTELAFKLPWQLLVISAGVVTLICVVSAMISITKVFRLEPAIVFRS